jgi:hypothetical protein
MAVMKEKGYVPEKWFDENGFPRDTALEGNEIIKRCTLEQLHMQRHMILNHEAIRDHFDECLETSIRDQKYRIAKAVLEKNREAEQKLKSSKTRGGTDMDWETLDLKDFVKLKSELVQAFVRTRKQKYLVGTPVLLPTQKGSLDKIHNEMANGNQESEYLIKWAFDCRNDPVIAQDPGLSPTIQYRPSVFPLPVMLRNGSHQNPHSK